MPWQLLLLFDTQILKACRRKHDVRDDQGSQAAAEYQEEVLMISCSEVKEANSHRRGSGATGTTLSHHSRLLFGLVCTLHNHFVRSKEHNAQFGSFHHYLKVWNVFHRPPTCFPQKHWNMGTVTSSNEGKLHC